MLELKNSLYQRGINLLLNFGPDHLGRLPGKAVDVLEGLAEQKEKENRV